MTISEFAIVISIAGTLFAIIFAMRNNKRQDHADVERRATESATVNVKLDEIRTDVKETRNDMAGMRTDISAISERVAKVEESGRSLHKRLDTVERKVGCGNG